MVLDTGHDGRTKVFWLVCKKYHICSSILIERFSAPSQIWRNVFIVWRRSRSQVYPKFCDLLTSVDLIITLICIINHLSYQVLIILMGYLLMYDDYWRKKFSLCICHHIFHISGSRPWECQKSFCLITATKLWVQHCCEVVSWPIGIELSEKNWYHLSLQVVPISGLAHGLCDNLRGTKGIPTKLIGKLFIKIQMIGLY